MPNRDLPNEDLIAGLRRAASVWFKNDDLLLLEELIRRYQKRLSMLKNARNILQDGNYLYVNEINKELSNER